MDPNETLRFIRACVRAIIDPRTSPSDRCAEGQMLAEHVVDLDAWLAQGGFLPEAWARKDSAPTSPGADQGDEPESRPAL